MRQSSVLGQGGTRLATLTRRLKSLCPLDDNQADVIGRFGEPKIICLDGLKNVSGPLGLDLADFFFQQLREVAMVTSCVIQESVGVEKQDIPLAHQPPFV